MGHRGPAPTPTEILRLRGSKRANRRTTEPKPERGIPSCPQHLGKTARAEWRRVTKPLDQMGVIAKIDRALLAAYCASVLSLTLLYNG